MKRTIEALDFLINLCEAKIKEAEREVLIARRQRDEKRVNRLLQAHLNLQGKLNYFKGYKAFRG